MSLYYYLFLIFVVAILTMSYILPLFCHKKKRDNRTDSQKILDSFRPYQDNFDINEFIQFVKNEPEIHHYKIANEIADNAENCKLSDNGRG